MRWVRTIEGIYLNVNQIAYILDEEMSDRGTCNITAYMSDGKNFVLTHKSDTMDFSLQNGKEETRGLDDEMHDIFIRVLIGLITSPNLETSLDMDDLMHVAYAETQFEIERKFNWTKEGWKRKKPLIF